jgi:hypothetical protein
MCGISAVEPVGRRWPDMNIIYLDYTSHARRMDIEDRDADDQISALEKLVREQKDSPKPAPRGVPVSPGSTVTITINHQKT